MDSFHRYPDCPFVCSAHPLRFERIRYVRRCQPAIDRRSAYLHLEMLDCYLILSEIGSDRSSVVAVLQAPDAPKESTIVWTPFPDEGQGEPRAKFSWASGGEKSIHVTVVSADDSRITQSITVAVPPIADAGAEEVGAGLMAKALILSAAERQRLAPGHGRSHSWRTQRMPTRSFAAER